MAPALLLRSVPMNAGTSVAEAATLERTAPLRALLGSRPAALRPIASVDVSYRVLLLEGDRSYETLLVEAIRAEIPGA